jgi:hypothetical protein
MDNLATVNSQETLAIIFVDKVSRVYNILRFTIYKNILLVGRSLLIDGFLCTIKLLKMSCGY